MTATEVADRLHADGFDIDVQPARIYAGPHQRAIGAWSWWARAGRLTLGSCFPMGLMLRCPDWTYEHERTGDMIVWPCATCVDRGTPGACRRADTAPLGLDLPGMWEAADLTGGAADSGMLRCDDCQRWASRLHPIPTNPATGGIDREVCTACKERAR